MQIFSKDFPIPSTAHSAFSLRKNSWFGPFSLLSLSTRYHTFFIKSAKMAVLIQYENESQKKRLPENMSTFGIRIQSIISDSCCTSLNLLGLFTDQGPWPEEGSLPLVCRYFLMYAATSFWGLSCHSFITSLGAFT